MKVIARRRQFGKIRKLPSGMYQASFIHPESGQRVKAKSTFAAKADANAWLATVQADISRGDRIDDVRARTDFETFSTEWLQSKTRLRPRTLELYDYLLRCHIQPTFATRPIGAISATEVRSWHAELGRSALSEATIAKAYRLLRQILEAAVEDRLRRENPCRIKGAATERSVERKIPTVEQVQAIAGAISPQYRAMVLLAGFAGLRRGECLGLERRHLKLGEAPPTVTVDQALVYTQRGGAILQEPKTDAGYRTLALPGRLADDLRILLATWTGAGPNSTVFVDPATGSALTKDRFRWEWTKARRDAGFECSFHDLRHVAGTLNAVAGATTKEAMARLGHTSPDAALRYQHAAEQRDAEVAAAVDQLLPS